MKHILIKTALLRAWKEELTTLSLTHAETLAHLERNALIQERLEESLAPDREEQLALALARHNDYADKLLKLENRRVILQSRLHAHEMRESTKSLPRRMANACLAALHGQTIDRGLGRNPAWKVALQKALAAKDLRAAMQAASDAVTQEAPLHTTTPDWITNLQTLLKEAKIL